jgi:sulfoxide reductase catalytic subunit YedY
MQTILDIVEPNPQAKWVVFYSLGEGADKGIYYDAHPIEHMAVKGIKFVAHYSEVGGGYGGYNEDHEFFGYRQSM